MKKIIGILITVLIFTVAVSTAAASATVATDKKTVKPGDTVTITGNAATDENVVVKITDEAGNIVFFDAAKADASGNYTASFVVPSDMTPGKLTVTAGSGSDVAAIAVLVEAAPQPSVQPSSTPSASSTPKPTAAPSSSPSASSTPKPTAVPSSSPTDMPTPAASSGPTTTIGEQEDVPDTGDDEKEIVPIRVEENEEAGTVTIEINVSDLPEGTAAVRLPNGEIVKLDGSDTLRVEIKKSDIGDDGLLLLTAIDEEGTPLGAYAVQLTQFSILDTSSAWEDIWSVLKWVLIGMGGLGAAGAAVYLIMKKRNRA